LDTSHNRIELNETDALALHRAGKRTLVFGELKTAVRFSEERGNTCPNYWHFSPYGFCPYDCKYCYLAGTQGVKFSPTVKIYVNLPEMLGEIDRIARRLKTPAAFYLGKLQDALALDPLTAYSTVLVPFFAEHPYARLTLLTKSANVDRLLGLDHQWHTILSWSVNPPEVCEAFEENVPTMDKRLEAMRRVASAGYPVRAVMMPIIPVEGWQDIYSAFTSRLLESVPIQRLTLGGVCIYRGARKLMERKMGLNNAISSNIEDASQRVGDGRTRYPQALRREVYSLIVKTARHLRPELELALCLEELELWRSIGLEGRVGYCNCVL
jgi:spore photoproduct lyase